MISSLESIRAAYDAASDAYSRKFIDELERKPFDRELLLEFSKRIGAGKAVLDIGCGPGHTTAKLASLGVMATGVDISQKMIEQAKSSFPQSTFEVGDFLNLARKSSSIHGILAFYCIVHLASDQLVPAFSEMHRVLEDGGVILLSFHVGSKVVHVENFLDTNAILDFTFFEPSQIHSALTKSGFHAIDIRIREPYESEHPSTRCYVFATKCENLA